MITLTREEAQSVLYALSKGIRRNDWKPVCDAHNEMKMRLAQPEPKKALVMRGQKDKVVAIYRENDEDIIRAEMPHEELLRDRLSAPEPPCKTGSQCIGGKCPQCVVREWQGLTDEEREEATGWSVEHIEAKLREKNL